MGPRVCVIALALGGAVIGGCGGGTSVLTSVTRKAPPPVNPARYLAQMSDEQAKLSAAEQRIPTRPRTPAALSKSISLLAAAVARLADGLAALRAPPAVGRQHARLVSIVRAYRSQLVQAARIAVRPGGELRAEALLVSATDAASRAFTATVARINTTLQR
jgi:hypothetical protein